MTPDIDSKVIAYVLWRFTALGLAGSAAVHTFGWWNGLGLLAALMFLAARVGEK